MQACVAKWAMMLALVSVEATAQAPPSPSPAPPATPPAAEPAPMSLGSVTTAALQQASAFRQAQIDEQIAAEDLKQARAALLPRLRDAFTVIYNSPAHRAEGGINPSEPSFIANDAIHEYQNLLGATGDWNFGLFAAVRRARALLDAARAGTEVARRAFVRGVAETYYAAALQSAKRRAAEESLAAAEEFERVTNLNYEAGEVPEIDVIRARLQTAARRDDLAQARRDETIAHASLGTLLGYEITRTPSIEALPQTIDRAEFDRITSAGIVQRPELAQLEAQARAAHADAGVARAGFLPGVSYSVDQGFDASSLAREDVRQHRGVLATATIDVPLFDWGTTRSRQRQAELRARAVELQRQLTLRALHLQFASAREEAAAAAERVDNARRALADAERNVTVSVARYRAGEAPVTEATDAQTTLAAQRVTLQQALFDYQIALAHLREAGGE